VVYTRLHYLQVMILVVPQNHPITLAVGGGTTPTPMRLQVDPIYQYEEPP